jgi:hypothetical protein
LRRKRKITEQQRGRRKIKPDLEQKKQTTASTKKITNKTNKLAEQTGAQRLEPLAHAPHEQPVLGMRPLQALTADAGLVPAQRQLH